MVAQFRRAGHALSVAVSLAAGRDAPEATGRPHPEATRPFHAWIGGDLEEMNVWRIKTYALFHDPPHKPLALGRGHERQGRAVAEQIIPERLEAGEWEAIKTADRLAGGADREGWLRDLQIDPRREMVLIHPLHGRPVLRAGTGTQQALELFMAPEVVDRAEQLCDELAEPFRAVGDDFVRYLLLWRFLPAILRRGEAGQPEKRLGVLWELLPADTRIPDHTVPVHDSLVAALAPILAAGQEAALLRFSIGPVQPFIAASRKLRDLWAGSSILADATWQALVPVVSENGPDCVLFPVLNGEPRFDRWLLDRCAAVALPEALQEEVGRCRSRLPNALRVPSLPNVFVAILPAGRAKEVAQRAEEEVRAFWKEQARAAGARAGNGKEWEERALKQAEALLEVNWSVAPWPLPSPLEPNSLSQPRWTWHRDPPAAATAVRRTQTLGALGAGGYQPNGGILYPDVFDQAGLLLDDAKRERLRGPQRPEGGLKCSICGEREVLGGDDFWNQRSNGRQRRADREALSEGEQLCGPCTWKRHYPLRSAAAPAGGDEEKDFAEVEQYGQRHPSTGEIAASAFKLEVIRSCCEGNRRLQAAVEEFARAAAADPAIPHNDRNVFCVAAVDREAARTDNDAIQRFARIDGQYLLPFPREEGQSGLSSAVVDAAKHLRKAAIEAGIAPPRPYLAVVVFDGDEMGKWISGTHDAHPRLREVLHPRVVNQLQPSGTPVAALEEPRFLGPAVHAAISRVAATFSRITAPMTVEGEDLPGHLVYAGGDDALFLAPVPAALELVWRLRRRFSGWPWPFTENPPPAATPGHVPLSPWVAARLGEKGRPIPARSGDTVDVLGLAFGGGVTASAGMCVFHYRWPLGSALEMAREAEQRAKASGRNALGITIQRRSGSITQTVVPFDDPGSTRRRLDSWDLAAAPVERLLELVRFFAAGGNQGQVSPRLASALHAEIAELRVDFDRDNRPGVFEAARALASRVVARRDLAAESRREDLLRALLQLGDAMKSYAAGNESRALGAWVEAVTAAAFLAREGER